MVPSPLEVRLHRTQACASDAALLQRRARLLDPEERARAERFVFERHRQRFVAAHGFLREVLGRALGRDPARLSFEIEARGKPRLAGAELHFSLTHTGDHVLLALAEEPLGLDAEEVRPARVGPDLARRVMAAEEFASWSGAPRAEQVRAFFRLWSAKESVMKACGLGLELAPGGFSVFSPGKLELASETGAAGSPWSLVELPAPEEYAAALATPRPARVIETG
jgi:4'-phosphopantetheinyl transferase